MKLCKPAALVAVLVLPLAGVAGVAPAAHGQAMAWEPAPQSIQIFAGGGRIGVSIRDVTDEDVKRDKLSGRSGVVVEDVRSDSPADKAGFRVGDVVTDFDGERVRSVRQFTRLVQETPAGRSVQVTVFRDGRTVTLTVEPREDEAVRVFRDIERRVRPAPVPPRAPTPPALSRIMPEVEEYLRPGRTLGISVSDLSPQLADYFGTKDGVLVTSVADNSTAAKVGLKAGDVITALDGTNVNDPSDVRRAIQRLDGGEEFTIQIVRDKKPMTLKGKMDERPARRGIRTVRTSRTTV